MVNRYRCPGCQTETAILNAANDRISALSAENSQLKLLLSEVEPHVQDWVAVADAMGASGRKGQWESWLAQYASLKTPLSASTETVVEGEP